MRCVMRSHCARVLALLMDKIPAIPHMTAIRCRSMKRDVCEVARSPECCASRPSGKTYSRDCKSARIAGSALAPYARNRRGKALLQMRAAAFAPTNRANSAPSQTNESLLSTDQKTMQIPHSTLPGKFVASGVPYGAEIEPGIFSSKSSNRAWHRRNRQLYSRPAPRIALW